MSRSVSLDLQPKLAPSIKQMQRLMMSQQMQQALEYLQLPIMELEAVVEQEFEQNPILELSSESDPQDPDLSPLEQEHLEGEEEEVLEKSLAFDENDLKILEHLDEDFRDHFNESAPSYQNREDDKLRTYHESLIQAPTSLFDHLMRQAEESFSSTEERAMAEEIIGNLDEQGFLQMPLEEMDQFSTEKLKKILKIVQTFEPVGVAAKDLKESLLTQLKARHMTNTIAYTIVEKHFASLLRNHIPLIRRALGCSEEELKKAFQDISKLNFHPGSSCVNHAVQAIRPDAFVRQEGETLFVEVEDDFLPPFRLNRRYLRMVQDKEVPEETKEFIHKKLLSAKWLLRTVHQRNETLKRIVISLTTRQRDYFLNPGGQLVPLTMKAVAEELEMNESTIARAVANKYIDTPRGLLPLRSFFTTALTNSFGKDISSQSARELLLELIQKEDKQHPLSDDAIAARIQAQGILCARRTIAKYRTLLKIGNAHQRKRY